MHQLIRNIMRKQNSKNPVYSLLLSVFCVQKLVLINLCINIFPDWSYNIRHSLYPGQLTVKEHRTWKPCSHQIPPPPTPFHSEYDIKGDFDTIIA